MPTWEQLTHLNTSQPPGHELGPVTRKATRSPSVARLVNTVGQFVMCSDTIEGIRAGDLAGGSDDAIPCESEPGIPGGGLSTRSMCLGGAANRARAIIAEAARRATEILDEAMEQNRHGWEVDNS
jgi:hypothetical protein